MGFRLNFFILVFACMAPLAHGEIAGQSGDVNTSASTQAQAGKEEAPLCSGTKPNYLSDSSHASKNDKIRAIELLEAARAKLAAQTHKVATDRELPEKYKTCAKESTEKFRQALACTKADVDHPSLVQKGKQDGGNWKIVPEAFSVPAQNRLTDNTAYKLSDEETKKVQERIVEYLNKGKPLPLMGWKQAEQTAMERLPLIKGACSAEASEIAKKCGIAPFMSSPTENPNLAWARMNSFAAKAGPAIEDYPIASDGNFSKEDLILAQSLEPQIQEVLHERGEGMCNGYAILQDQITKAEKGGLGAVDAFLTIKSPGVVSALVGLGQSLHESYTAHGSAALVKATGAVNGSELVKASEMDVSLKGVAGSALAAAGTGLFGAHLGPVARFGEHEMAQIASKAASKSLSFSDLDKMIARLEVDEAHAKAMLGTDPNAIAARETIITHWFNLQDCHGPQLNMRKCREAMIAAANLEPYAQSYKPFVKPASMDAAATPEKFTVRGLLDGKIEDVMPGRKYSFDHTPTGLEHTIEFSRKAVKEMRAKPQRSQYMLDKIETGDGIKNGIKYLSDLGPGVIEIKNLGHGGHQRYIGCIEKNHIVIHYYGAVSEDRAGYSQFRNLCK